MLLLSNSLSFNTQCINIFDEYISVLKHCLKKLGNIIGLQLKTVEQLMCAFVDTVVNYFAYI